MSEFIPAESFHPAEYIEDELQARGWSYADLAQRMGMDDFDLHLCEIDLYLTRHPGLRMDQQFAESIGRAFGTGAETWLGLEKSWLEFVERQVLADCGSGI